MSNIGIQLRTEEALYRKFTVELREAQYKLGRPMYEHEREKFCKSFAKKYRALPSGASKYL